MALSCVIFLVNLQAIIYLNYRDFQGNIPTTKGTEDKEMYNNSKSFFSKKRAVAFMNMLSSQGIESALVSERDYLNDGTLYYVKWN